MEGIDQKAGELRVLQSNDLSFTKTIIYYISKKCTHKNNSKVGYVDCTDYGLLREIFLVTLATTALASTETTPRSVKVEPKAYLKDDGSQYVLRLNYGVTARHIKRVCVSEAMWYQTFHVNLPTRQPEVPLAPVCREADNTTICADSCTGDCKRVHDLYVAISALQFAVRQSIRSLVNHVYTWIPDINSYPHTLARNMAMRKTRAPFGIIGSAYKWLFGTALSSDVEELREALLQAQDNAQIAAQDAQRVRDGVATFTKLQNERMDRFHTAITEQQMTIDKIVTAVSSVREEVSLELQATTIVVRELQRFVTAHDEVQELAQGIDQLIYGQLSPKLINTTQLRNLLTQINGQLTKEGKRLCYTTPREVLMSSSFDVARMQSTLIIRLAMPYSRHRPLHAYQSSILPMPVPGRQNFITTLRSFPKYFIGDASTVTWGETPFIPQGDIISTDDVTWLRPSAPSCAYYVLTDDPVKAQNTCDIAVSQQTIPTSLLRIATGVYVASNFTNMTITCNDQPSPSTLLECSPCLIHLDCNCTLSEKGKVWQEETQGCHWEGQASSSVLHAYNLALINEFYQTGNETLSTQYLLQPHQVQSAADLELPIFGGNISQILAADKTDSYLLAKVSESLKSNSIIYHNPTQAILDDVLRTVKSRSFISLDLNFVLIIVAYVILGFIAKTGYQMYQQMTILKLTAPAAMIAATHAYELKPIFASTTPISAVTLDLSQIINSMLADIRHIDMAYLTVILIIIIGASIIMIIGIKKALGRYSYLYIEIMSGTNCLQLRFARLPDASRTNIVRVPRVAMKIQLTNYGIFGILSLTPRAPKILNTLTNVSKRLSNHTLVTPWTVYKIRRLIETSNYTVSPIVVNTHEYNFLDNQPAAPTAPEYV